MIIRRIEEDPTMRRASVGSLVNLVVLVCFLIISDGRHPQVCRPRYLWASWEEIIWTIRFLDLQHPSWGWSDIRSSILHIFLSTGQCRASLFDRTFLVDQTKLSAAIKQKILFSSWELRMLLFTQQDSFLCSSLKCKEKIQWSCQD